MDLNYKATNIFPVTIHRFDVTAFDKILSDDRILDRASSVTESYDTFINEAHQYDTSNWWRPDWRDSTSGAW